MSVAKSSRPAVVARPAQGCRRRPAVVPRLVLVLVGALLLASTGAATTVERDTQGGINLQWENDAFGVDASDRHYTNGLRLSYVTPEDAVWPWVASSARWLPFFPDTGRLRSSFAIGQNLYTPEDISTPDLVVDDRPYAGWLYFALGLIEDNDTVLDVLEFSIGVVGPAAGGEAMQKKIHQIIDSPEPMGWHNQLDDELALLLSYERKWRNLFVLDRLPLFRQIGWTLDCAPYVGGTLGNIFIYGAGGFMLRLGNDLPVDYGPPRIRPSMPGSDFFIPRRNFGWYLFGGLEGRLVLRNIFLDGNTFQDSHSVDKVPLVGDLQFGLALVFRPVRVGLTYVWRSKEFENQRVPDHFGAITVSVRF